MADIAVWVNGHEKLLTGVSRATTCQDIIKTLLQDNPKVDKISSSSVHTFALYERWRDCERPLAPRTRVYKLWKAWGNEQENVKFLLKNYTPHDKSTKDMLNVKENKGKMRKTYSKRRIGGDQQGRENTKGLSVRKSNPKYSKNNSKDCVHRTSKSDDSVASCEPELIPSAVCGPEVIGHDDDANNLPKSLLNIKSMVHSTETFNQLVQLVVRQSQQLEDLLDQAQNIDREIEFYETKIHLLRVEENGKNYVQDAYLASRDEDTESKMAEIIAGMSPSSGSDELETYIDLYERILHVEQELSAKRNTITTLSDQIEQQRSDWDHSSDFVLQSTDNEQNLTEYDELLQSTQESNSPHVDTTLRPCMPDDKIGFTRAQIEKSAQTCVAQRTELTTLQKRVLVTETLLDDKSHWMRVLTAELQRLEETERVIMSRDMPIHVSPSPSETSREDKRLQELLQLVRQPLQPIQETSEEDTDDVDVTLPANLLDTKAGVSDDASSDDTGLSSLHSQDEQEQYLFEIISETLV
ncbi:ras association domain-containing protein 10-like isoform X2 [Amphiura filiformis]